MTAFWVCLAIWAVVALAFFCFLDLEYDYESRVGISVFWPVFLVFCAGVGIGWLFYVGRKLKLRRLALQKAKNGEKLAMSQQWLEAQLQKINEQGLGQHATGKLMGYAEKKTYYDMGSEWDIDYIGPPPSSPPPHGLTPKEFEAWYHGTFILNGPPLTPPPSEPFLSVDIESKT